MSFRGKEVLVTGASGFIGSHLTEALVQQGATVRALVHYNSRNDIGNLGYLTSEQLENVQIISGDIADSGCVDSAVAGVDCVFHLAALIGIPYSYVAPRSYVSTNIIGTLNVLDSVRAHSVPRMVHTSTSETYGTALYEPIDEKHPLQGQSPYSASKIGADKIAESYYLSFETPVATIRPFNTYGPRQSMRAIIPTIIRQLLAGKETIELGSLTPKRDFTFVEDTVRGFIAVASSDAALGNVTNVGSGKTITIGELADMLVAMINPNAKITSVDTRVRPEQSEVMALICDAALAAETCDWRPEVSLKEGLQRVIDFVREDPQVYRTDQYVV